MAAIHQLVISVAVAYVYAIAARPILRSRTRIGAVISVCATIGVLLSPLLISHDQVILRALASVVCIELLFKMVDYARLCRQGSDPLTSTDYFRFLVPFPPFLIVINDRERRLSNVGGRERQRDILRALIGAALFASGFWAVSLVSGIAAVRTCFALDHAIKLVIFVVTIESLSRMFYGLERLAGYDTSPAIQFAFLSRTVAEFWFRYNNRVHVWFDYNVFRPIGRRAPFRGILLVFFVSGILHELMFAVATSRIDGYQFTFFMLQAPAVGFSRRLERFARSSGIAGKTVAHSLTVLWFYAVSVFFFHGVNRVFPFFYASNPWLP